MIYKYKQMYIYIYMLHTSLDCLQDYGLSAIENIIII